MAKVTVECDVTIPEGWEIDKIAKPRVGEHYLYDGTILKASFNFENSAMIILKRKAPSMAEVEKAILRAMDELFMRCFFAGSVKSIDLNGEEYVELTVHVRPKD